MYTHINTYIPLNMVKPLLSNTTYWINCPLVVFTFSYFVHPKRPRYIFMETTLPMSVTLILSENKDPVIFWELTVHQHPCLLLEMMTLLPFQDTIFYFFKKTLYFILVLPLLELNIWITLSRLSSRWFYNFLSFYIL